MQFIPSVKSYQSSELWKGFPRLELRLEETALAASWLDRIPEGLEIRTLHLPPWNPQTFSMDGVAPFLQAPFDLDFLVLPVPALSERTLQFQLLSTLELFLEILGGRGIKIALRPEADTLALVTLVKSIRADAIGYCWDAHNSDWEAIADRLFVAYGTPEDSFQPLHELGYRWDIGLDVSSPDDFKIAHQRLSELYPDPLFPKRLPDVPSDPEVSLGEHWNLQ